jgi:hypothetical protein
MLATGLNSFAVVEPKSDCVVYQTSSECIQQTNLVTRRKARVLKQDQAEVFQVVSHTHG